MKRPSPSPQGPVRSRRSEDTGGSGDLSLQLTLHTAQSWDLHSKSGQPSHETSLCLSI